VDKGRDWEIYKHIFGERKKEREREEEEERKGNLDTLVSNLLTIHGLKITRNDKTVT